MHIAVMGSGGLGGYFGARLAAAGTRVTFIARGAHLEAMRANGLRVLSALGDAHLRAVEATDDPAAIGPVDLVTFTVKLYDSEPAARAIRPLIGPGTGVVTFQNGVESVDLLSAILGREHVVGGIAQIPSTIEAPGVIRHTGALARLIVGELDGRPSRRTEAFLHALGAAGVEARLSDRITTEIWEKFVFLAPWSGMCSITRCPLGLVRDDPELRAMLLACVEEAVAVGRAGGIDLAPDLEQRTMAMLDTIAFEAKPSTLHDLERGRRLEVPWLSGAVVRLGRELGVATPTHAFIAAALKPWIEGAPRAP